MKHEYKGELVQVQGKMVTFELDRPLDLPSYMKNDNGTYDFSVQVLDSRGITPDQLKYTYCLLHDIVEYTGYQLEEVKDFLKTEYCIEYQKPKETFSLAYNQTSLYDAREFITFVIEWCFKNEIPFQHHEFYIGNENTRILFLYLKYRRCFISGEKGEICHVEPVGMGRNRNKIDHSKHHLMCLSHFYHMEQHTIGLTEFMKKYHVVPIKLNKRQLKEIGIRGNYD